MTYIYEELLEQHFQMLCQALLVSSYPDAQCMPVGMPDGGRDALASGVEGKRNIIFQVKFARRPSEIRDHVKWVCDAIDGELAKIQRLVDRGATDYVLITNIFGTSHLDVGRIDLIQRHLDEVCPVTAQAWWREDLDRRLDGNFDVKLRYPSVMTGVDLARLLWERLRSGNGSERRDAAIRAYLAHQYDQERNVRFKQAELESTSLFDLFIDVPIQLAATESQATTDQRWLDRVKKFAEVLDAHRRETKSAGEHGPTDNDEVSRTYEISDWSEEPAELFAHHFAYRKLTEVGAAELLLDPRFQQASPLVVIEGSPGQGKSTLTQYLAQINRVKYLDMKIQSPSLKQAPPGSIRLPFRMELRDLARWLGGQDPWSSRQSNVADPRTLESAIAGQINRQSGGLAFTVEDLAHVIGEVPVLLLLDGLDEVADLDERRAVVEQVTVGVSRMLSNACDLQAIVTSRPTAIAGSPAFSGTAWEYFSLSSISPMLALDYADKWAEARNILQRDRQELKSILREKMTAPHLQELAKNTMQLSILLSLIQVRGTSLPDKRTELYDTYVDVFFNREAEKDQVVRDNRRLLKDIHYYLGYELHAAAESSKNNGRVSRRELESLLRAYLKNEGRATDLLDALFKSTVERIVALVSRVEGTYEFEVQPLREYFAARHLYESAPYSPPGRESTGTRPDRFDAVARRPFWSNVTRFYAGCFSKGELAGLAERICALLADPEFRYLDHPRMTAISALRDLVFSQSVWATEAVINATFDEFGIRWFGASIGYRSWSSDLSLDSLDTDAKRILLDLVFSHLRREKAVTDRLRTLCDIARSFADPAVLAIRWTDEFRSRAPKRCVTWLKVADYLGIGRHLLADELDGKLQDSPGRDIALSVLVGENARFSDSLKLEAVRAFASSPWYELPTMPPSTAPAEFALVSHPGRWARMLAVELGNYRVSDPYEVQGSREADPYSSENDSRLVEMTRIIRVEFEKNASKSLAPWQSVIDAVTSRLGATWICIELGVMSAGVRSFEERGAGASRLFDVSRALTDRCRYARYKTNDKAWWAAQFAAIQSDDDATLWFLCCYVWADPKVVGALFRNFDAIVKRVDGRLLRNLADGTLRSRRYAARSRRKVPISATMLRHGIDVRTLALFANRLPSNVGDDFRLSFVRRLAARRCQSWMATIGQSFALRLVADESNREHFDLLMKYLKRFQTLGARAFHEPYRHYFSDAVSGFSEKLAKDVLDDCWDMPDRLIWSARIRLRNESRRLLTIVQVADSESWFVSR